MTQQTFAFSYSRWTLWTECPRHYKYRNIDKLPEPTSPAMARGRKVHDDAAKYLMGALDEMPDLFQHFTKLAADLRAYPAELKSVEQQVAFDDGKRRVRWFGANVEWRMIWDVATWNAEMQHVNVVDWKTGKPYGSYDDQMEVFALPAFWMMPGLETVDSHLIFLDTGDVRPATVTRDQMFAPGGINEKWRDNRARIAADTEFPATPSERACRFCAFSWRKGGPCRDGV